MRIEFLCIFALRHTSAPRVKFVDSYKYFYPPVVYATDRSKAVVPVLFLCCVALWFILRDATCFKFFPCSLSSCFFIPFSIVFTSLGKRELVCVLLVHLFVCFVRVNFCHFSFPFDFGGWLRFVIVALPGLFYKLL